MAMCLALSLHDAPVLGLLALVVHQLSTAHLPSACACCSFGHVQLEARVGLLPGGRGVASGAPALLACAPLPVALLGHLIRTPSTGAPTADAFFRQWSVLPAHAELQGESQGQAAGGGGV